MTLSYIDDPVRSNVRPWRSRLPRIGCALAVGASALVAVGTTNSAFAAPGTIDGTVFRDFDYDGVFDTAVSATAATDVGLGGVTVEAFDDTGALVGTAVTAADGTYSLAYSAAGAGTDVRVELALPVGYRTTTRGTNGGTTVQFKSSGDTADFGLALASDYSQDAPDVIVPVHPGVLRGTNELGPGTDPTLTSLSYDTTGDPAIGTDAADRRTQATSEQTGTLWGTAAYDATNVFSAALFRRHATIGPSGLGAIYVTQVEEAGVAADPDASLFVQIPDPGTNPRGVANTAGDRDLVGYPWARDAAAFPEVFRIGLGDIDISVDRSTLYAINLNTRSMWSVPVVAPAAVGGAPTAGAPVEIPMPLDLPGAAQGCAEASVYPFGITTTDTAVFAALTCTGPTQADLRAYIYKYDLATGAFAGAPSFETTLDNPTRGIAFRAFGNYSARFNAWNDTFDTVGVDARFIIDPQPLVSDIEFDVNGDLSLAIADRNGYQTGFEMEDVDPGVAGFRYGMAAGDLLRACGTEATGWVLESGGVCGGRTGSSTTNNLGPDGGEFYFDLFTENNIHDQTSIGATEQVPGFASLLSTQYNPTTAIYSSGYTKSENADGSRSSGTMLNPRFSSFGKSGGIGDLEALTDPAPIEIGNRVWFDVDRDGVQDPGEAPISMVTLRLLDSSGNEVATTTTDADGEYYFNDSNVPGGLLPTTEYRIVVDNPVDFAAGGPLDGLAVTVLGGAASDIDNDGVNDANGFPGVSLTTGSPGDIDHTFDFGFVVPSVSVGDFVFIDENRDGVQDSGDTPVAGATMTLTGPNGDPVVDVFGNPVSPVMTDVNGLYTFDNLPALSPGQSYTVTIDPSTAPALAGYVPTMTGQGTGATDSSTGSALSGDLTSNGDRDDTLDFGFVVPSVSVGDFVFIDENRDGVQDSGDTPVAGATMTLTGPNGDPVVDVFGNPVSPVMTDVNGLYTFDNLPALSPGQSYTVTIDPSTAPALAGYVPTMTGQGTGATDSSTGSALSGDLTSNGDRDDTLDFGFVAPVPELPATGNTSDIASMLLISLLLVAMGIVALGAGRRGGRVHG